jgi:GntR family transcriptional regulator
LVTLNYRDARPIYAQIADSLRHLIVTGALEPDERLPSVRQMAMELSINPNTIQRSYADLESQGYVYTIPGKGCFAAHLGDERRRELLEQFRDMVEQLRYLQVPEEELIAIIRKGENT